MEEIYDFSQHTYCAVIFIAKDHTEIDIFNFKTQNRQRSIAYLSKKNIITYNIQITKVLSLDDPIPNEGEIQINNFMDELYRVFTKDKKNEFLTKAVSDFISLAMKELMQDPKLKNKSLDSLFYTLIVPSEWEKEIKEDILRPIFIQANLISKENHKDRLLFLSDVESICYRRNELFKRNQNTIMCRIAPIEDDKALIKVDLIKTPNTLFDIPNSMLFSKVVCSNSFSISSDEVKNCIKTLLNDKLFPDNDLNKNETLMYIIEEEIYDRMEALLNFSDFERYEYYNYTLKKPFFTDTTRWKLNTSQRLILESFCPFDICAIIGKPLFNNMKDILSNQFIKKYNILVAKDVYSFSGIDLNDSLSMWMMYMLEYSRQLLNALITLDTILDKSLTAFGSVIVGGGRRLIEQTIQDFNVRSPIRTISAKSRTISSSVFINSKADAILNIDISLKSTLLSYSLLSDDGSIKEMFGHDYFMGDKHLPSLEQFYNISNKVCLKVQNQFILFADKYLLRDTNTFSVNEEFLSEIEALLYKHLSVEEKLMCIYEQKYIRAFLLMYLIYIKEVITNNLSKKSKFMDMRTGYAISIQKIMLGSIVDTKEDLEDIIYKSGLIEKNDEYKKLRIITPGEGVLSIIQQSFNLEFPVKSYFLLAQLHEDYIQLTLNRVVTAFSLEDKQQEAIIIEDKVISIQSIYDSFCQSMWNNLIEDCSVIQLCNLHNKNNDNYKTFEIFSLETKKEFMSNFKKYISKNILAANANLQNLDKNNIKLNRSCDCKVYLTVTDIIEILFKPLLNDLTCIISSSLMNEEFFGKYTDIKYYFSSIHFNHNPQLQDIIASIIKENERNFNPKRGIDTLCMVIPKLPNQFFQPLLLFLCKAFQKGMLYQIYARDFAFRTYGSRDDQGLADVFPLLKKEHKTGCSEIKKTFYIDVIKLYYLDFMIDDEYQASDFFKSESISKQIANWFIISTLNFVTKYQVFKYRAPLVVTIKYLGYLSLVQLSARYAGDNIQPLHITDLGSPVILRRF